MYSAFFPRTASEAKAWLIALFGMGFWMSMLLLTVGQIFHPLLIGYILLSAIGLLSAVQYYRNRWPRLALAGVVIVGLVHFTLFAIVVGNSPADPFSCSNPAYVLCWPQFLSR